MRRSWSGWSVRDRDSRCRHRDGCARSGLVGVGGRTGAHPAKPVRAVEPTARGNTDQRALFGGCSGTNRRRRVRRAQSRLSRRGIRARAHRAATLGWSRSRASARRRSPRAGPAAGTPGARRSARGERPAGVPCGRRTLRASARPGVTPGASAVVRRRAVDHRAGRVAPRRAHSATARRAGRRAGSRPRRRSCRRRPAAAHRPALRQRAGRFARAVAGDRPQTSQR